MTKPKNPDRIRFCIVCGRRLPCDSPPAKKLCSKRCRNRRRTLRRKGLNAPYEDCTEPPLTAYSLTEIQHKAQSLGLSYGQYVAKYGKKE